MITPQARYPKLKQDFYRQGSESVARLLLGKTLVHEVSSPSSSQCVSSPSSTKAVPQFKQRLAARIVETEAYLGVTDKAAHSFGGRRTPRTESMYLEGGHAYVFLIYGLHSCFNIVTGHKGIPEAVLIRAVQPIEGIQQMAANRKLDKFELGSSDFFKIASGPGKLCQALQIDRSLDRHALFEEGPFVDHAMLKNKSARKREHIKHTPENTPESIPENAIEDLPEIWIEDSPLLEGETIYISSRVGIDYAEEAIDWPLRFSLTHAEYGRRHISKPWPEMPER